MSGKRSAAAAANAVRAKAEPGRLTNGVRHATLDRGRGAPRARELGAGADAPWAQPGLMLPTSNRALGGMLAQSRGLRLQRKCACAGSSSSGELCDTCRSQQLQRKGRDGGQGAHDEHASRAVESALSIPGQPLPAPVRGFMEARFDHQFDGVRLHTDQASATATRAVGASAYTIGRDIFFAPASYAPHTASGLHLLAHELTHVVQQERSPFSGGPGLTIDPAGSAAEVEADRMADAALKPGPLGPGPRAHAAGLSRSTSGAALGAGIGAVAGGLLGALAGPIGVLVGAALGAALGTWIGAAASNSKQDDSQGSPLVRINRLLGTGLLDWVVTEKEALQALAIVQEVERKDPVELFELLLILRMNGKWEVLRKKLPAGMRLAVDYYDNVACHPDHGYVMPGDVIHLELLTPGEALERGRVTGKSDAEREKARKAAGAAPGAPKPQEKESVNEWISHDYNVDGSGVVLPYMGRVPIVGKSLGDAAKLVAQAFADPLWALSIGVELTPVKRGASYAGRGEVSDPEKVYAEAKTRDEKALGDHAKRAKFTAHVPWSLAQGGRTLGTAVFLYYDQVDNHLDRHDDPETLWLWARAEAERRVTALDAKTPAQEFIEFAQRMMSRVATQPAAEQARTRETYNRFVAWLSRHSEDPKLALYKPVDIWVQAALNVFEEEIAASQKKAIAELREKRRTEAWKKGEEKFGDVISFAEKNIWPSTRTESISSKHEEISETSGERITKSWLISASPAEKIIRDKIASDFLHAELERLQADPEAFGKTSVNEDFHAYLKKNPEQLKALQITTAHPTVERFEDEVDIPAWETAKEIIVGFIPFVGTAVGVGEAVGGDDLSGHPLSTTERVIIGVTSILPGVFKALKAGRGAFQASRVVREFGLAGAEADRVWRIYVGLGEGTRGAQLFKWGAREIGAGRRVEDPKVIAEMQTILKDLGMTDRETAKALMPAVQRQAEVVVGEEIEAVKRIAGPISADTEKLLTDNPALREALKESDLATRVLKKCVNPCFPEGTTPEQVRRLEGLLEEIRKTGAYDEDALRSFLHKWVTEAAALVKPELDDAAKALARQQALDRAINEVAMVAAPKNLRDGTAASKLDLWTTFYNKGEKITYGISPEVLYARKVAAHDLGVAGGRAQAKAQQLTISTFETPFKQGGFGQGFDDIAIKGSDWDKDLIYIIEHKGGTAALNKEDKQMELVWVVKNIQRLYLEGGPYGQIWAQRLAKALQEGRLAGKTYSTAERVGETTIIDHVYVKTKVSF